MLGHVSSAAMEEFGAPTEIRVPTEWQKTDWEYRYVSSPPSKLTTPQQTVKDSKAQIVIMHGDRASGKSYAAFEAMYRYGQGLFLFTGESYTLYEPAMKRFADFLIRKGVRIESHYGNRFLAIGTRENISCIGSKCTESEMSLWHNISPCCVYGIFDCQDDFWRNYHLLNLVKPKKIIVEIISSGSVDDVQYVRFTDSDSREEDNADQT